MNPCHDQAQVCRDESSCPRPYPCRCATRAARTRGKKPSGEASARSPLIERLVAWRKKQDLTQKETAARLDINFDTYKSYECGHRNPSGPNTHKILALIGV